MRLPQDRILHIDTEFENGKITVYAEWQGELVRCKDCRYCTEYYDRDGYPYWMCDEWDGGTDANGFCHCGERKGGGNE